MSGTLHVFGKFLPEGSRSLFTSPAVVSILCGMRKQLFVACLMQCISIDWGLSWPNLLLPISESGCIKRSLPYRSAASKELTFYRTRRLTSSEQFGHH